MLVDIIGSKVLRKATEFKNFPYKLNNFIIDQSILSLRSKSISTSMKEINTTDLTDITIAHRDLNKGHWEKLNNSNSDILIIDLLGELRSVSEIDGSYYSSDSLSFIGKSGRKLSRIEQFRTLLSIIDKPFIDVLKRYEKVILMKFYSGDSNQDDFIDGIFKILEDYLNNTLVLEYKIDKNTNIFEAPLEFYHEVNNDLKRFVSHTYENQLLFKENFSEDIISVKMNYIGERLYIYELFKNGKPFKKSEPTTSKYYEYHLDESAKYRFRVSVINESMEPRFSNTYEYNSIENHAINNKVKYVEMPNKPNLWLLNIILATEKIEGIIGNVYKHFEGYEGYPIFDYSEIKEEYLSSSDLLSVALNNIEKLNHIEFTRFINENESSRNTLLLDFISFIKTKR